MNSEHFRHLRHRPLRAALISVFVLSWLLLSGCSYEGSVSVIDCDHDDECPDPTTCVNNICAAAQPDAGGLEDAAGDPDVDDGCGAGLILCDGRCVDPSDDVSHCGGCDNQCTSTDGGQGQCLDGVCRLICAEGFERCGSSCVDTQTNVFHCGGCDDACPSLAGYDVSCVAGSCESECFEGTQECNDDGVCMDLDADPAHCGVCNNSCLSGECADGVCLPLPCDSDPQPGDDHYPFGGGSGDSETDPFTICTAQQLNEIGNGDQYLDRHFALVADIDLADLDEQVRRIGAHDDPFTATFDGNNHEIRNLDLVGGDRTALFVRTSEISAISHIRLVNAMIDGSNQAASLVGRNDGVVSHIEASVDIRGRDNTGGLVALNFGQISDSHVTGRVQSTGARVGGLVGRMREGSEVSDSTANVEVIGWGERIGGLIGDMLQESALLNSSAQGPVRGFSAHHVGGLVGRMENQSRVVDSHALGTVSSNDPNVGGLVGDLANRATITTSYSEGSVIAGQSDRVGGLVGRTETGTLISESHSTSNVSGRTDVGGLVGENNAPISESYATGSVSATGENSGGLIGYNKGAISETYATGDVYSTSSRVGGLVGLNFGPIDDAYATGSVSSFSSRTGGLVGYNRHDGDVDDSCQIQASHASGTVISIGGANYIGGLIGRHRDGCSLLDSFSTGDVHAADSDRVGGLVGLMNDSNTEIRRSFSTGRVHGSKYVGGLVGRMEDSGLIIDSYATGSVRADDDDAGGLVGRISGQITNCYATGFITSDSSAGGLVSDNGGTVTDSYWNLDTTGQDSTDGDEDERGEGLTNEEFIDEARFENWSFDGADQVWEMSVSDGRPILLWETTL